MNGELRELVEHGGGLVTRAAARQVAPEWALQRACDRGELVRVLPEVFVAARLVPSAGPDRARLGRAGLGRDAPPMISRLDADLAHRAALAWAEGRAALSHLSALSVWRLRRPVPGDPLHLTAAADTGLRSRPGVIVHRRDGFAVEPRQVARRGGLTVTRLEQTLVDSWPLLPPVDRRAPLIEAVNERLTTPERVWQALAVAPRLVGRAELRRLLGLLTAGCRSPLEIWGHEWVFTGPGMPTFQRQVRIRVGRRTMYLDLFAELERVNIELDGAAAHGDPRQREIDVRRDALLASVGILVVRFTHRRLVRQPDEVRRETLAILARRREAG